MNEKGIPDYQQFPDDIGKLVFTKCATAGCHNDASKGAAGGLSMESWNKMFEGGTGSACVIPYRSDYSTMCYYTNTYSDIGVTLEPTMPYNKDALSREDVLLLKNWIDAGAPSRDGFVKFSDNPNRKKIYVTNQGCDVVTVFDAATLLPMRYINVGNSASTESPHNIKISPDGKFWYIISIAGNSLQKYSTADDHLVGEAILGFKNWNTLTVSNDGNTVYAVDWSGIGDIAVVNTNDFSIPVQHNGGLYLNPHGSCMNPTGDSLYVTQNFVGSYQIYKIPVSDFSSPVLVSLSPTPTNLNTHDILFSPDGLEYFVTCQGTSEVRIMQTGSDQLLATIPVGAMPSEMAVSASHNLLFVTCEEDTSVVGKRGSIAVIDITTNSLASTPYIYSGHQPHGISLDDSRNLVFVANRNVTTGGPAPHHSGACGGKNGYVTFIDMNTLTLLQEGNKDKKVEVSVDPYSVAVRH
jgi:YVTN family beta-propeller protein